MYGSEGYQSNSSEPFQSAYTAPIRIRAYMNKGPVVCLGFTHYRTSLGVITHTSRPSSLLSRVNVIILYTCIHSSRKDGHIHVDICRLYDFKSCLWKEGLSRKCRCETMWNLTGLLTWAGLIKAIMFCFIPRSLYFKFNQTEVLCGIILLNMELTEFNVFFFFFKNYSKLDSIDSKCSWMERLVKSLVGIENTPSERGPYGISCYAPLRRLTFIAELCVLWFWGVTTMKLSVRKLSYGTESI